jgi:membrane protein DedA with SNARE-associated domain/rhodanese-related sulfurtransferase
MNQSTHAWWDFGYTGIFVFVLLDQIGVPIPAFPALLAAGALVATGSLNLPACLIVAVVAALAADSTWYAIGRLRGNSVLHLMCRLSWKPDVCVGKTKSLFAQHGTKSLIFAKFIPGLSTLAPPLAGISRVPFNRFILYDGMGTVIWAIPPLFFGAYLQEISDALKSKVHPMMPYLPWICVTMIFAVLIWRYFNRRNYLRALHQALSEGIAPEKLKQMIDQADDIVVLDIRDELTAKANPVTIASARWIPLPTLASRISELPTDKPVIVYCDCPQAQGSAAAAKELQKSGVSLARPLLSGLRGWIAKGFETAKLEVVS